MSNKTLSTKGIINNISRLLEKYSSGRYEFITQNSPDFVRCLLNAEISKLLNVEVSDSYNIYKTNQRALYYFELRILIFLRSNNFDLENFNLVVSEILGDANSSQYFHKVDLQLLEVLPTFKQHIYDPIKIDKLIKVHQYVSDLWKNGSKYLHFYTLHNQEHSIELIKQCVKIKNTIDYLKIKSDDYYILFLACYLHDISMALHPNLEFFTSDNLGSELLYSEWKRDIYNLLEKTKDNDRFHISSIEGVNKSDIKTIMLEYFKKLDEYFEKEMRDKHATDSARFIKGQNQLNFIDKPFLQLVADVSVAHNYDAQNIYKVKSNAKEGLFDIKYLMIMLRLADLLDMSRERVSTSFMKQNMKHMSPTSQYHWISHMSINHCHLESDLQSMSDNSNDVKIKETIKLKIYLNTKQLSGPDKSNCCQKWGANFSQDNQSIIINIGEECNSNNCCISCKWFVDKQWWLFNELYEFQTYLERNDNNLFKTSFQVELHFDSDDALPQEYLDVVLDKIDK